MITDATDAPAQCTRRVIHCSCTIHGGARGFANLVVAKRDGLIVFDSHATGQCVLELGETAATQLRDQVTEWLGE